MAASGKSIPPADAAAPQTRIRIALTVLRAAIGWHFLYEGLIKLADPTWTAAEYLRMSRWALADFFQWIADTPSALALVDWLNVWGLILIGAGLLFGALARTASVCGALLLLFYYAAYPAFGDFDFGQAREGHYYIVNKTLVEMLALLALAFLPARSSYGVDGLIRWGWARIRAKADPPAIARSESETDAPPPAAAPETKGRRELLANLISLPVIGGLALAALKRSGWRIYEEDALAAKPDALSGATIKIFNFSSLQDLKGRPPMGRIGDLELSRLILGGNLIGGWAHARDLIYVSKLVKAYHHNAKIFETLMIAEKCGINAILTNPALCGVINEYWRRGLGEIKFISDCAGGDLLEGVRKSIDQGACACYVQGQVADKLIEKGEVDTIAKALEMTRAAGLPAGIGAHYIETIQRCVELGFEPDFWMKTLHHLKYWSARNPTEKDNIYCHKPDETIAFMRTLEAPFIAFKTLAAGAIQPKDGFKYAFENGADFICVGMYDFQIVDDVNLACSILEGKIERERPWRA